MTHPPRFVSAALGAVVLSGVLAGSAAAQQQTPWAALVNLTAGWTDDTMSIAHAAPLVNPDSCPVTNAGYATNPADPGHKLFHTVLISAFLNHREVSLLVSGCVYGKPRVISVAIR